MKQERKHRRKQRYGELIRKELQPSENKRLVALQKDLLKLGDFPSGDSKKIILYNIGFFDAVSRFQDEGYLKYQPDDKKETQDLFNLVILRSGRQNDPAKWNPTKKGEKVTKYNVIYGGVYGLPIKPAIYWLSLPKSKKVVIDFHSSLEPDFKHSPVIKTETMWETDALVTAGIERFTKKNSELLLKCIDKLLK